SPRCGSDRLRLAAVFASGRAIVFLTPVLELVGIVRASCAFEDSHAIARRVWLVTYWRMVSGRIITREPTLTCSIVRAWIQSRRVLTEMPNRCAARRRPSRGSMGSRGTGEGMPSCHATMNLLLYENFVSPAINRGRALAFTAPHPLLRIVPA